MQWGIGASQCAYVKRANYSDWDTSGAIQGAYGNNYPRVGAIRFAGLHSSVIWADQEISQIVLSLRFLAAGSNRAKTLHLYRGAKSVIDGTGQSMIGAPLGTLQVPNAYNSVQYVTLSATSNAALFSALVQMLEDGQTETIALYANETPDGDWSDNYCKIDAAIINLEYEPRGSRGTLNKSSVDAGQSIVLSIDPLDVSGTVTHRVQWMLGDASSSVTTLPLGTTSSSYTIPMSWCNQITDAERAQAACRLTTLVDGDVTATRDIPFAVTVPASVVPSFTPSISPHGTTGGYYQHIGAASIAITGASALYGATITGYRITGGEGTDASASSVTTDIFAQSGDHAYTLSVTDSRGRTASQVVHANVAAVSPVDIQAFYVQRYSTVVGDDGQPNYVASSDGDHVWVTILAACDLAGGNNTPIAKITYTAADGDPVEINVAWGSGGTLSRTNDRTVITAQIPVTDAYAFELVVADDFSQQTASAVVSQSWASLHIPGHGYGVGIGMYAQGTPDAPALDVGWLARMRGGIEGVTIYSEAEQPTGGWWVDGRPVYRRTYLASFSQSDAFVPLGTLPEDCAQVVRAFGMLYTGTQALLIPNAFYQSLDYMATPLFDGANISLALGPSFGAGTKSCALTVEYVKTSDPDAEGRVTMPPGAMTSDSQYGCVVSASGSYITGDTFRARNAFDRNLSSIWASNASGARWLQLEMPVALTDIVVEVYEQSGVVLHPVAGTVQGSNDGADWTGIGSFANWNTVGMGADGLLGTISCGNSAAYRYVRLNVTACVNNQQCDIAEMRVRGKI